MTKIVEDLDTIENEEHINYTRDRGKISVYYTNEDTKRTAYIRIQPDKVIIRYTAPEQEFLQINREPTNSNLKTRVIQEKISHKNYFEATKSHVPTRAISIQTTYSPTLAKKITNLLKQG